MAEVIRAGESGSGLHDELDCCRWLAAMLNWETGGLEMAPWAITAWVIAGAVVIYAGNSIASILDARIRNRKSLDVKVERDQIWRKGNDLLTVVKVDDEWIHVRVVSFNMPMRPSLNTRIRVDAWRQHVKEYRMYLVR
jgi:hypothetical protein